MTGQAIVESRLAGLAPHGQMLVWTLRTWVQWRRCGHWSAPPVDEFFGRLGIGGAAQSVHAFLVGVASGACRPIEVHCPGCSRLSADECAFVEATIAIQCGSDWEARALLEDWLSIDKVESALASLLAFATWLDMAAEPPADEGALPGRTAGAHRRVSHTLH